MAPEMEVYLHRREVELPLNQKTDILPLCMGEVLLHFLGRHCLLIGGDSRGKILPILRGQDVQGTGFFGAPSRFQLYLFQDDPAATNTLEPSEEEDSQMRGS